MKKKLVVDSCIDINLETEDITSVPFKINIDNKEIIDSKLNIEEFIEKIKNFNGATKTSCPSPDDFMKTIGEYKNNFIVTISSKLSGSYNAAILAANLIKEKFPEKFLHVFDSKTASAGETLVALKVKEMIDGNKTNEEIIENTNEYINNLNTFFILDSLDNLAKNGRITNFKAFVGNLLNIVPIMGEDGDGNIVLKEQIRGKKKAFKRLIDIIGEKANDIENTVLGITHVNCKEKAEALKEEIKSKYPFRDIKIFSAGGLSSVYAYDGGIVIAF